MRQQRIIEAARTALLSEGLGGWTVERVAREAGCAKGLVHYHFGSKLQLLAEVAGTLRRDRVGRRSAALAGAGAEALDGLWRVLEGEVASGECAAWFALAAVPDRPVRAALSLSEAEVARLSTEVAAALDTAELPAESLRALLSTLDGLQLPLLLGEPLEPVRETYDRLWLGVLDL